MMYLKTISSPLGKLTLSSNGSSLTGLWFEGQKDEQFLLNREKEHCLKPDLKIFSETESWLFEYFQGKEPRFTPKLEVIGSNFEKQICSIIFTIPFGQSTTYGSIAKMVAKILNKQTMSAQAVGGAVARNPISIIIPCHRVLGSNDSLTGYAGGLERKVWLLKHEHIIFNY